MNEANSPVEQFQHDLDVVEAACNLVIQHKESDELLKVVGYDAARWGPVAEARITLTSMPEHRQFDHTRSYPWWLYRTGSLSGTYIRNVMRIATKLSTDPKFKELLDRMVKGDKT
jgi:hypothetical protein